MEGEKARKAEGRKDDTYELYREDQHTEKNWVNTVSIFTPTDIYKYTTVLHFIFFSILTTPRDIYILGSQDCNAELSDCFYDNMGDKL